MYSVPKRPPLNASRVLDFLQRDVFRRFSAYPDRWPFRTGALSSSFFTSVVFSRGALTNTLRSSSLRLFCFAFSSRRVLPSRAPLICKRSPALTAFVGLPRSLSLLSTRLASYLLQLLESLVTFLFVCGGVDFCHSRWSLCSLLLPACPYRHLWSRRTGSFLLSEKGKREELRRLFSYVSYTYHGSPPG